VRHAKKSATAHLCAAHVLFVPLIFLGAMSKILGGAAGARGTSHRRKHSRFRVSLSCFSSGSAQSGLILALSSGTVFGSDSVDERPRARRTIHRRRVLVEACSAGAVLAV